MKSNVKIYNTWQLDTKVWYIGWNEIPIRIYHNENLYESGNYVSITLNASTGWTVSSLPIIPPSPLWYFPWTILAEKSNDMLLFVDRQTTSQYTCTATADSWYQFYKWEINWEEMVEGEGYWITQDTTITAVFVEEITISLLANDWWKFMDTGWTTINSITVPNTKLEFVGTWHYPDYDWVINYWDGIQWQAIAMYKCADEYQILTWIDNVWQTYEFPKWGGNTVIFPDAWSVTPVSWLYNSSFSIDHPSGTLNLLCEDETWDPYLNAYWTLDDASFSVVNSIAIPSSSLYVVVISVSSTPYQFAIMFKDNLSQNDYWYANIRADFLNHSLNRIEYRRANGTVVWTFDLTTTGDALPLTWWIQSGDKVVMVINSTPPVPTFTVVNTWNYNTMNRALESATGLQSFGCWASKILLWNDWYYYYATTATESWRPLSYKNCYAKISRTWDEWSPVYTVEDYYLETAPSDDSSFCNYFGSGDSSYIPAIASYVWDPSIVDVQTLWAYIYNKL